MEKATISELKNRLRAYLKKVRAGHSVHDDKLARLERAGLLRRARVAPAVARAARAGAESRTQRDAGVARRAPRVALRFWDASTVHALRADSLQLAAAALAAERDPATLALVSLDERLCDAAAREGFEIVRA